MDKEEDPPISKSVDSAKRAWLALGNKRGDYGLLIGNFMP